MPRMKISRIKILNKKEERKKTELKFEPKDFGPISGGKITLKPLTLFIGPNNSGKSYVAMLIHSIFESYTPTLSRKLDRKLLGELPPLMRARFFIEHPDLDSRHFLEEFPKMKKEIDGLKEEEKEVEVPQQFIEKVANKVFEEIYEKRLGDEIVHSYACPLNELIRIGKSSFELKINFNSYCAYLIYQKDKLKVEEYPRVDIKIKVKIVELNRPTIADVEENENEILIKIDRRLGGRLWGEEDEVARFLIMDIILDVCVSKLLESIAMPCYYLPAARSGILQGHKALAASVVKNAPYVGIERLEIPKFSGVVSDFIFVILTLPEEEGPFYRLAQDFEKELIKGEIVVRTLDKYLQEIKYSFQGTEIPLHRASSTVSELAPLFLYLKYIVGPNSILIIEEPEAHLHPSNQRILAKFLVKLIRKGVNLIITTHSEYLIEQLNNFIMLSEIEGKKRVEKYKYDEEDFLKLDEIAAYLFRYDKKNGGYKIVDVEITKEDGISDEEFLKIHEALYEETIELQRDLTTNV